MNYVFITSFFSTKRGRLSIAEEWLIVKDEQVKKLLSLFKKTDFIQLPHYEAVELRTALVSNLESVQREKFFKMLDRIAQDEEKEILEPFNSFPETGISLDLEGFNNFYTKKK